jgi:hypothetical protein
MAGSASVLLSAATVAIVALGGGALAPRAERHQPSTLQHPASSQTPSEGIRVAVFYTKVYGRILGPLLAADCPPVPADLRRALHVIDNHVTDYVNSARLRKAA